MPNLYERPDVLAWYCYRLVRYNEANQHATQEECDEQYIMRWEDFEWIKEVLCIVKGQGFNPSPLGTIGIVSENLFLRSTQAL